MDIFFKSDENFDKIIADTLKGKKIVKANQITTGWTNIVYEVETDDGNYFFRFPFPLWLFQGMRRPVLVGFPQDLWAENDCVPPFLYVWH